MISAEEYRHHRLMDFCHSQFLASHLMHHHALASTIAPRLKCDSFDSTPSDPQNIFKFPSFTIMHHHSIKVDRQPTLDRTSTVLHAVHAAQPDCLVEILHQEDKGDNGTSHQPLAKSCPLPIVTRFLYLQNVVTGSIKKASYACNTKARMSQTGNA
jgi:hypothetical protein